MTHSPDKLEAVARAIDESRLEGYHGGPETPSVNPATALLDILAPLYAADVAAAGAG